jgi:hypothetical protein
VTATGGVRTRLNHERPRTPESIASLSREGAPPNLKARRPVLIFICSHHSSTSSARGPPSLSPSPALYSHNERPMRE